MADIIEGRNPVIEALKAGRPINKITLVSNFERGAAISEILRLAWEKGIPVEYVPRYVLDKQSTTRAHQGVMAFAAAKGYVTLDDLFSISREKNESPFYVVLDGIEDPQNLGSVLRTAEASGVHGVIIRSRRAVGLTAAVVKASAGAVEYVPVARVPNIPAVITALKNNNVWVIGVDSAGAVEYTGADFKPATAIVIGGEGKGVSSLVKKRCDSLVSIPMRGQITSLNASVAAALVMYEVFRQRRSDDGSETLARDVPD